MTKWLQCMWWVVLLGQMGVVAAQDTLRVRVRELPPLMQPDGAGKWKGLDVELLQVLLDEAKLGASYQVSPGKRAHAQLQAGEIDVMLNISMTAERKQYIHFIGPARSEEIGVVVPKDSNYSIRNLDDFKAIPGVFGVQSGSFYGAAFDAKFANDAAFAAKFEGLTTNDVNIKKMNAGRLAGFFSDPHLFAYRVKNDPDYANAKLHPFVVNKDAVYFAFSKKSVSAAMLQRLQQAFDRAQAAGKFEKVLKRYR